MPGAGHIVHMPGHIYMRVGRYIDAVKANVQAVAADEDYITQCHVQGLTRSVTTRTTSISSGSARRCRAREPGDCVGPEGGGVDSDGGAAERPPGARFPGLCRTTRWCDSVVGMKCWQSRSPRTHSIYTVGVWHYARGMAFAGKGQFDEAGRELQALRTIVSDPALAKLPASSTLNTPDMVLRVAPEALAGEIAARRKDYDQALLHLERAVRLEDALVYTEPPDWHYPIRQSLGAALLAAGRPVEAEAVYRDDLRRNRENGWSLFGLIQALDAQGKKDEAAAIEKRFEKAWSAADVKLTASRF